MLWIILMLMCLRAVKGEECSGPDIIVGRLGKEMKFELTDFREKLKQYVTEHDWERLEKEIKIQYQNKSEIRFKDNMNSIVDYLTVCHTNITLTNNTLEIKSNRTTEDAGVYWIEFDKVSLGQNASTISGGTIDDYTSILQLECHSVSKSIDGQQVSNSIYIVWYKDGKIMTNKDPISSEINVTVDQNGGNLTCLATEYFPHIDVLHTTKSYNAASMSVSYDMTLAPTQKNIAALKEAESFVIGIVFAAFVTVIVVTVIAIVILVIRYKKYQNEGIYESVALHQGESLPETPTDKNSKNGETNLLPKLWSLLEKVQRYCSVKKE